MVDTPRTHAIQVSGTCPALSQLALVSQYIAAMYRIVTITVHFPAGCAGLVRVYLFVALDPSTATAAPPPGTSILSMLSRNDFLVGDGVTFTLDINLPVGVKGTWLKAYVVNADAFPHRPIALFTIQEMLEP